MTTLCLLAGGGQALGAQALPGVGMIQQSPQGEVAAYRARVQRELSIILNHWGELAEQKDSAAMASLYTANARATATGSRDAWGPRAVVSQLWHLSLEGSHFYVVVDDFDMSGDIAYVSSVVTIYQAEGDATPTSTIAKGTFIFYCDSHGRWRIRGQALTLPPERALGNAN